MLLCATLAGCMLGQLLFGILGDWLGRKNMYGWLLVIIMWATLGLAMSAQGAEASMSISAWLFVWRFFMGIGIGGDYPLSATITSEFAPTKHRSTMLACLFFMQPVGQFIGTVIAIIATAGFKSKMQVSWKDKLTPETIRAVDRAWRVIVGFGAVPALIAWVVRLGIPESPRFTMDILLDTSKAERDVGDYFIVANKGSATPQVQQNSHGDERVLGSSQNQNGPVGNVQEIANRSNTVMNLQQVANEPRNVVDNVTSPLEHPSPAELRPSLPLNEANNPEPNRKSLPQPSTIRRHKVDQNGSYEDGFTIQNVTKSGPEVYTYAKIKSWLAAFLQWLGTERNSLHLAGTTLTWGLLDFSFYGLGMSSASTIQEIWDGRCADNPGLGGLYKRADDGPEPTVYDILLGNAWHSSIVVSIGALSGGAALIYLIQRMRPKSIQIIFFAVLGLFLVLVGAVFRPLIGTGCPPQRSNSHWGVVVLYVFCQVFFNLGANATTFIVSVYSFNGLKTSPETQEPSLMWPCSSANEPGRSQL